MRIAFFYFLSMAILVCHLTIARAEPVAVAKTNPMKVYMHYMPWFETPDTLGGNQWGYHWKMNTQNPNVVDGEGRRQIASHFYPKIGPYDSNDPAVIEYHMLLMKFSGVDGIMLDWYGTQGTNGDIGSLLSNSNSIVNQVGDYGLDFSVVMEDRFSANIGQAEANVAYLRDNYFNKPNYTRIGEGNDPLLNVFGPITFQQESQWSQILAQAGEDVDFNTLWYESGDAGANADGEYAWIYEDAGKDNYADHVRNFYVNRASTLETSGGIAFPGFEDFYVEGGVGQVVPFEIPHNDGQTLATTLSLANQYKSRMDYLQLATFNDFGEGTIFEPTVETGFDYLVQLQQFTGTPYSQSELELVYQLYRTRKEFAGDAAKQTQLDQVSSLLSSLQVDDARTLLDLIASPADFNGDGIVNGKDFLVWQRQYGSTGLYPLAKLAADGNADGIVDQQDLLLWQHYYIGNLLGEPLSKSLNIPEPATIALLLPIGLGVLLRIL